MLEIKVSVMLFYLLGSLLIKWADITKYHRPGGSDNRHLFLIVLEAGVLKIKVPADLIPGKGLLLGLQMATFLCLQGGKREISPIFFL